MKKSHFGILSAASSVLCLLASTGAFAYGGYSSIVLNTATGVWGTSYSNDTVHTDGTTDSYDRASAETMALNSCNSNPNQPNTCNITLDQLEARPYPTAVVETYATNGWVAIATGPNGAYGTSGCADASRDNCHDTQADAEGTAVNSCNAKLQQAGLLSETVYCSPVRSFASYVDAFDINGTAPQ